MEQDQNLSMTNRRKAIKKIYSSDSGAVRWIRSNSWGGSGQLDSTSLERIIKNLGGTKEIMNLTDFAYATEPTYAEIIDYLANMYLWRYYYLPVEVGTRGIKETNKEDIYAKVYHEMSKVVDGLAIEVTFPVILTRLFKEGVVYLFTERDAASGAISTLMLNPQYCTPVMMSQYGTGIYKFDLQYFDSFGVREEELEKILELFPSILVEAYRDYKKDSKLRYLDIDGRFGTYISLNNKNFPTQLTTLHSILDYHKYRANEVERSSASLDKIITHKIPVYENTPIFEIPEVEDLHKSMASSLSKNSRLRLLTTFGDTEVHSLQENGRVQNETLERAIKAVYQSAGLNTNLFTDSSEAAITTSLYRNASVVWKYIQQLLNFYNLTINNLYNFRNYQVEIVILPITHYSLTKDMELYRRNAEFGVGKLELIVASGTKQKHIAPKSRLEEFLKLEEILIPLKSSHTQSGNADPMPTSAPVEDEGES